MKEELLRTAMLLGEEAVEKLQKARVAVFGIGGVGGYTVEAFYGNESEASRNDFYVYGKEEGTIKADGKENVNVVCAPTCGRITVDFEEGMSTYFADYNVVFTGTEALAAKPLHG